MTTCMIVVPGQDETYSKDFEALPAAGNLIEVAGNIELKVLEVVSGPASTDQPDVIVKARRLHRY